MKVLILTNGLENYKFVDGVARQYGVAGEDYVVQYLGKATFPLVHYDIGISFMYQHKVPAKEVNSHPWFNFHPAPLPEYKGRDLCYHAIMNGDKEFGATLHYMDEGFDTGDIIDVRRFPLYDFYTAEDVSRMAISVSEALFMAYLPKILETPVFSRLPNVGGTYYKKGQIIKEPIVIDPNSPLGQTVRAITYKEFHPVLDIGGVKYKIVREE
jgi:methionyl-tRNA formyltransferase